MAAATERVAVLPLSIHEARGGSIGGPTVVHRLTPTNRLSIVETTGSFSRPAMDGPEVPQIKI